MSLPNLSFDILVSLASGSKYGYLILLEIEKLHSGQYKPSVGMLYVALQRLMDGKLIREDAPPVDNKDERRQYYALTSLGASELQKEAYRRHTLNENTQQRLKHIFPSPSSI